MLGRYTIILNIENIYTFLYHELINFINKELKDKYRLSFLYINDMIDVREYEEFIDWVINKILIIRYDIDIIGYNNRIDHYEFVFDLYLQNKYIIDILDNTFLNARIKLSRGERLKTLITGRELILVREVRFQDG